MDSKYIMKKFECKHHPNEQIQRICSELDCENTLCCIECILTTHGTDHKSSLASIKDFIKSLENKPFSSYEPDLHYHIGISYANLNNFEDSIPPITKVLYQIRYH